MHPKFQPQFPVEAAVRLQPLALPVELPGNESILSHFLLPRRECSPSVTGDRLNRQYLASPSRPGYNRPTSTVPTSPGYFPRAMRQAFPIRTVCRFLGGLRWNGTSTHYACLRNKFSIDLRGAEAVRHPADVGRP